jgi:hypothetical protein
MVFEKGGKLKNNGRWYLEGQKVEAVNGIVY